MLKLVDVLEALTNKRPNWADQVITDAVVDSRQVIPGCLFVALPGERVDGHDFVSQAFEQGASFALVQRDMDSSFNLLNISASSSLQDVPLQMPICLRVDNSLVALQQIARYWRRKFSVKVIGITGSVGKSTTKEVIAGVMNQRFYTLKNPGNLNNEIGLPLTILRLSDGHECMVLEMGFYVHGEISFLCEIAIPQIGVITNIGTVHAERAGSQEAIAQGKSELVQCLPEAPEGVAILNYDDVLVRQMAEKTKARVFFYGLDDNSDLWADRIESLGLDGIRFRMHYQGETLHLRVPMIGRHSVHTALRASAVGLVCGLTWQEIVNGLHSSHTQLRLVAVRTTTGALLLDDTYNASPQSMLAALNLLDELDGHKVAVLGDMLELGIYEQRGHEMVGVRAAEVVDELITVGVRGLMIAESARQAGLPEEAIKVFDDSDSVTEFLKGRLNEKDVVLIKGSHGMHMDRIISHLEQGE
jgi:UDP-N-acetylmuramoyl-tripeptide--D-alanyl-D-alanine ligase